MPRVVAVEKFCSECGKVMETFPVVEEAAASINVSVETFESANKRKANVLSRFYWKCRYLRAELRKPVEQICASTGRVLNSFDSIAAAARAVQISPKPFAKLCVIPINQTSRRGFLWRMGEKTSQDDDNKL